MRLLSRNDEGSFSLTDHPTTGVIPRYAILSHTWGPEEVTYKDFQEQTGFHKKGYHKIRFCGEQAERDGLRYFWVDTCCINRSSSSELTESINSMFRWYSGAAKCYVYLEDVPSQKFEKFEKSKWFTRGWTLQELIAPETVEFFSKDGTRLGDRNSLEPRLCAITGIPAPALQGRPLSNFTVAERMAWADGRVTTKPEDKAYSLLGIFQVQMPLIYGEGEDNAIRRLREEVKKAQRGRYYEDFTVSFSLYGVPDIEHFVAREQELAEMRDNLRSDGSRRVVVLHGLGGMGKTQLAIAYTKRYKDNYSAIFWINIKDENALKQSFARIARIIQRQHPQARQIGTLDIQKDPDETIDVVKSWLSFPNNTRWLLVYDNYDNPKLPSVTDSNAVDVQKYFPESYQGSVIITTRSSRVKIGHAIRMSKIRNLDDSLEILTTTSKREHLTNDLDAVDLAKKLDGLPLALATAGSYLEQTATTFRSYIRMYEESWERLQRSSPELHSYEDRTLYSTWQLSFNQIEQRNKQSAALLRLWAYFDNQDLWLELLQHAEEHCPKLIREATQDEQTFNDTVRVLSDYGLVEINTSVEEIEESRGYSIHSCVHSWTKHVLNQETDKKLAVFAINCIALHVERSEHSGYWLIERRLLPHAAMYNLVGLDNILNDNDSWIYDNLGILYNKENKLKEAEDMYQRALRASKKTQRPNHVPTFNTVCNLGYLYSKQGKLEESEKMYQKGLEGYEKALGHNHPSTLRAVSNLGIIYRLHEKLEKAEEMCHKALQGLLKTLGPNHTWTLTATSNLGQVYHQQGKLEKAEEMCQIALQGFEKAYGPNNKSTLKEVSELGKIYYKQGKLEKAEELSQKLLEEIEKSAGFRKDPTPHKLLHRLGVLYLKQGKLKESEEMLARALRGYEEINDHVWTFKLVEYLGYIYFEKGKLKEAEEMFQRALRGYEEMYNHMSTFKVLGNLGCVYLEQGKLKEAEEMFQRALRGYEETYGPNDHMSTFTNLGCEYIAQGKKQEAMEMFKQVLLVLQSGNREDDPSS